MRLDQTRRIRRRLHLVIVTWVVAMAAALPARTCLAQGCIAVRGGGQCSLGAFLAADEAGGGYLSAGESLISLDYRTFRSDRHFVGDDEFTLPKEYDAEAINDQHFVDLNCQVAVSDRFSATLTLPYVQNSRSTTYEHDNVNRHTTRASGLGDIRLTGYWWAVDPAKQPKGNVSIGLGAKLPTGDYKALDTFYSREGPIVRPVDQSIQPGDGGWGFTVEVSAQRLFTRRLSGYAQGYYLFNPENENGVSTSTGIRFGNPYEQVMSIPDQYVATTGLMWLLCPEWGAAAGLGARVEGVPVRDAIGDNDGFRRPGYAVSVEPRLSVARGRWTGSVSVPIAVYRNRQRSVADEKLEDLTGEYHHGDAAFADYMVTASVGRRF